MTRFWFWLTHNASSAHLRLMQRYLQRRGWIVFYLDPGVRTGCSPNCFLSIYQRFQVHGKKAQ